MATDFRKKWLIGEPVEDELDYYRNDDELVLECLGRPYEEEKVIRVLGARRFGKTSFLKRVKRWAEQRLGGDEVHAWDRVEMVDFQSQEDARPQLASILERVKRGSEDGRGESLLVLMDEFEVVQKKRELAEPVDELLERALGDEDSPSSLRVVIAAASNMDDLLLNSKLSVRVCRELSALRVWHMKCLSPEETRNLTMHAKRGPEGQHEPPAGDDKMLAYACHHPLYVQLVCHAYFVKFVRTLEKFEAYLERGPHEANMESIYKDLSRREKLVLRYLLHHDRATSNAFTRGVTGGITTITGLCDFGLVDASDGCYSIHNLFIRQYIRKLPDNQADPVEDTSEEVLRLWPELFGDRHETGKKPPTKWVIHHLGNLHVPTAPFRADRPAVDRPLLDSPVWKAYTEYVASAQPHLIVVAGDLLLHNAADPRTDFEVEEQASSRAVAAICRELALLRLVPTDEPGDQIIIVPGDTDPLVKDGNWPTQKFSHFTSECRLWDRCFCYTDVPILIAPFNSAEMPPEQSNVDSENAGAQEAMESRLEFVQEAMKVAPGSSYYPLYERLQKADFGYLTRDPEELYQQIARRLQQATPRSREPDREHALDKEHALRIAVFHHPIEQFTPGRTVDFWALREVKRTFARHHFSLALNAQFMVHSMHSETIYDERCKDGWVLNTIGCGAMSAELVEPNSSPSFNKIEITIGRASAGEHGEDYRYTFNISVTPVILEGGRGGGVFCEQHERKHTFKIHR